VFGFLLAALGVQLVLNGLSDVGVIHLTTGHLAPGRPVRFGF
jgi:hypothetical protein